MKPRNAAERLVVAADFNDPQKMYRLVPFLKEVGAYIKVNSILRKAGYGLIGDLRARGVKVFADLKLYDIGHTLAIDAALLRKVNPEILTVSTMVSIDTMKAIKDALPETEVLGVTVLTDCGDTTYCQSVHGNVRVENAVLRLAERAQRGNLDGLVASGMEAAILKQDYPLMSLTVCGVRPSWHIPQNGDDQNRSRIMGPQEAIHAGADRIVMGRPITEAGDVRSALKRAISDIESVLSVYK